MIATTARRCRPEARCLEASIEIVQGLVHFRPDGQQNSFGDQEICAHLRAMASHPGVPETLRLLVGGALLDQTVIDVSVSDERVLFLADHLRTDQCLSIWRPLVV